MNELALFAGGGGGILGGHLLGWKTVCAVEIEDYPRRILLARQRDGILPRFPIWDDVRTFDAVPWRGRVNIITGGFPCQDISSAGKGKGIDGERSGMWFHMARIIRDVRPRFVFVENSPMLTSRGLGRVLGDLAEMGLDAEWGVLGASDVGGNHHRKRIWILAYTSEDGNHRDAGELSEADEQQETRRQEKWVLESKHAGDGGILSNADKTRFQNASRLSTSEEIREIRDAIGLGDSQGNANRKTKWWEIEPDICRVVNGLAHGVDRLAALGNGQVPIVAATAYRILESRITALARRLGI